MRTLIRSTVASSVALAIALVASPAMSRPRLGCYQNPSPQCEDEPARALPTSVKEFKELRKQIGKTPWGGAALFAYALMVRLTDRDLAEKLLVLSLDKKRYIRKGDTYRGYALKRSATRRIKRLDRHPHCVRSYAAGTSPENDYRLDPKSVGMKFRKQTKYVGTIESGRYRVFLCSTGADSCRPIKLRRNNRGYWKVLEFSSITLGCRKPKAQTAAGMDDDL